MEPWNHNCFLVTGLKQVYLRLARADGPCSSQPAVESSVVGVLQFVPRVVAEWACH